MRQTARALGEGLFEARAPTMRSSAFGPLAETLNGMAERIQRLIATQKELSSAISHELRTPIARTRFALEMLAEAGDRSEHERLSRLIEADLDELDGLIDSSPVSYTHLDVYKRQQYGGVILMLTARDEDFDQIFGLELGADDYIAKPVQPRLLLARIKACLLYTSRCV